MRRQGRTVLRRIAAAGLLAGAVTFLPALPAAAHSGHFSCGVYYSTTPQNLKRTCSSTAPGASFRIWALCYDLGGIKLPVTKYGNWVTLNNSSGTSTLSCPIGFEPGTGNTQFTHN